MTIVEHFDSEDEAKARGGELISSLEIPRPVYGLQVTKVLVCSYQARWNVEIETKLVELPPTYKGVALDWVKPADLDDAYQKVLEENAVLRRSNTDIYKQVRALRIILDGVKTEPIGR